MLTVNNISKYLGKRELLKNVSFHVHPGERIGLVGPNGCGKSTLFHIVLGEIEPDSGAVSKTRNLRIGYLPQDTFPAGDKSILSRATDVHEEAEGLRSELESLQQDLDSAKEMHILDHPCQPACAGARKAGTPRRVRF